MLPASLSARTSRPGMAPTYVRRCPRTSASSRTPPSATRTNSRPIARATDSPREVLPTPGGPTRASTAPLRRPPTTPSPRSSRRLRTARNSVIRSLTSSSPAWSASSTRRASARSSASWVRTPHGSSSTVSTQVRIQPASGDWSLVRSSLSSSLATAFATASGRSACSTRARRSSSSDSALPPWSSRSSFLTACSCWRRRNSRCCLSIPSCTSLRRVSATSSSARCSRASRDDELEPGLDVGGEQDVDLLLLGEVRRVARGVGQQRRVGDHRDAVDELRGAALVQDRGDEALVVAGQREHVVAVRAAVRDLVGGHPQGGAGAGGAGADGGAAGAAQDGGGLAAGQAAELLDGRDGADRGVPALRARDEQQRRTGELGGVHGGADVGGVELDRHDHAGQDDGGVEGQDGEAGGGHGAVAFLEHV